ncbi:MAG: glycosyltransferase family 2 protein [Anaerolineae bacterium]|nr:glycosyltransferase family 2 protein [Anaerolineae bacterium]
MMDIGIVILNWNTRELLRRCLETVLASEGDFTYRVVVVDNQSTDGSPDMVREHFSQVELIVSEINGGYPYGNNLGLRALGFQGAGQVDPDAPRYVVLLNPDTEVPPDAFFRMTHYLDARPEIGMAGPKLVLEDGSLDLACRRSFPSPTVSLYRFSGLSKLFPTHPQFGRYNMTFADPDQELEVDSVVGAYMQVRREAIDAVGLLDETFFMYGEDLDWAYRIKTAGWKVFYYPNVIVKHIKRAASRKSPRAQFEFNRAMLIFYRKHYRVTTPMWLHTLVLMGLLLKGGPALLPEIRNPA